MLDVAELGRARGLKPRHAAFLSAYLFSMGLLSGARLALGLRVSCSGLNQSGAHLAAGFSISC